MSIQRHTDLIRTEAHRLGFEFVGFARAERLDEEFEVKVDTEVSFVKLVPLVGG